jgi:hypothetical protein
MIEFVLSTLFSEALKGLYHGASLFIAVGEGLGERELGEVDGASGHPSSLKECSTKNTIAACGAALETDAGRYEAHYSPSSVEIALSCTGSLSIHGEPKSRETNTGGNNPSGAGSSHSSIRKASDLCLLQRIVMCNGGTLIVETVTAAGAAAEGTDEGQGQEDISNSVLGVDAIDVLSPVETLRVRVRLPAKRAVTALDDPSARTVGRSPPAINPAINENTGAPTRVPVRDPPPTVSTASIINIFPCIHDDNFYLSFPCPYSYCLCYLGTDTTACHRGEAVHAERRVDSRV